MSFVDRIRAANAYDLSDFLSFEICGTHYGWIRSEFGKRLDAWPDVFARHGDRVALAPSLNAANVSAATRSEAVAEVCVRLCEEGLINGWRDEQYPVCTHWGAAPAMLLERAAVPLFGITAYGVHMNGIVRDDDGRVRMWIAKRSMTKPSGPGKLDQMVAGGQPHRIGLLENMVKECAEEAGISEPIARRVRSVGSISYVLETAAGLRPDVIFNFDLELPAEFQPDNRDGEVEAFYLMEMEEVCEIVESSERFKFNCALVVIDYMIRNGVIPADHPNYEYLTLALRPAVSPSALCGR